MAVEGCDPDPIFCINVEIAASDVDLPVDLVVAWAYVHDGILTGWLLPHPDITGRDVVGERVYERTGVSDRVGQVTSGL